MKKYFDNEKYVKLQSGHIYERIKKFGNKLYLEFGGKLVDDFHAARVLPGFEPDAKISLMQHMKDSMEVIFCISAADIERNKIRADFGITYGTDILRLIDLLRDKEIFVNSVVITQYKGQPAADRFYNKLKARGEKVYIHTYTKGYPTDVNVIVSDEGYGANPYIETTKPLVIVTAPGPGSGKLATCLSQLYHEYKRGVRAGYAKFETFPIWNIPLMHPVNVAYEAATADLGDVNMIDPFHLNAYGAATVNYNRDIEVFPVVRNILSKITGDSSVYLSPTDMGVNMAGNAIMCDEGVCRAAKQEIIRRYYKSMCDFKLGSVDEQSRQRSEFLLKELDLSPEDRTVVKPAIDKSRATGRLCAAIELEDGRIVTGKSSELLSAPSAMLLNALKVLSGLDDSLLLIAPEIINPILELKSKTFGIKRSALTLEETLIALSICATTSDNAAKARACVDRLSGCEAHASHFLPKSEDDAFRKLGINLTTEPCFLTNELYFA